MPLFGKKADPISTRSKALDREIAQLEAKIKKLNAAPPPPAPKPRAARPVQTPAHSPAAGAEPVFESVPAKPGPMTKTRPEDAAHFNAMGVRKYDLVSLLERVRGQFQSRPTESPKLIRLIAAGNIHGLRPLRYEKRVARNRFIFVALVLALVVWGIIAMVR